MAVAWGIWLACSQQLPAVVDVAAAAAEGLLWQQTRQELRTGLLHGCAYRKVDATTERFRSEMNDITLGGVKTGDVLFNWDEGKQHVLSVSSTIYNKGDDGEIEKEEFEARLKETVEGLNTALGVEGVPRKLSRKEAGVKGRAWEWETENCAALLEAAASGAGKKYVAEFIRISLAPKKEDLEKGTSKDTAKKSELKGHVKTEENGDVWIVGVPMVDQGEKGYCVPATVSRVFAYYGMDGVDQHSLAALCKSSERGTTMDDMQKALKGICGSFHMTVRSWEWINTKAISKKLVKKLMKSDDGGQNFDPSEEILSIVKSRPNTMNKGFAEIKKQIDSGIPVVWAVLLGIYPEQGLPQSFGGHMRLIIGYNEEKKTIIYSDTWGARHARKSMPMTHACAMTRMLCVLRPTR